jgi:hypothetical protein
MDNTARKTKKMVKKKKKKKKGINDNSNGDASQFDATINDFRQNGMFGTSNNRQTQ